MYNPYMLIQARTFAPSPCHRRGFQDLKIEHGKWLMSSYLIRDDENLAELIEGLTIEDPSAEDFTCTSVSRCGGGFVSYCVRPGSACEEILRMADEYMREHGKLT